MSSSVQSMSRYFVSCLLFFSENFLLFFFNLQIQQTEKTTTNKRFEVFVEVGLFVSWVLKSLGCEEADKGRKKNKGTFAGSINTFDNQKR
jgi:hypothetical protein